MSYLSNQKRGSCYAFLVKTTPLGYSVTIKGNLVADPCKIVKRIKCQHSWDNWQRAHTIGQDISQKRYETLAHALQAAGQEVGE